MTTIKSVKAYETSDKQTFTDELVATEHQGMLDIRGVIQSAGGTGNLSTTQIAKIVLNRGEEIRDITNKYKRKMDGIRTRRNNAAPAIKVI